MLIHEGRLFRAPDERQIGWLPIHVLLASGINDGGAGRFQRRARPIQVKICVLSDQAAYGHKGQSPFHDLSAGFACSLRV